MTDSYFPSFAQQTPQGRPSSDIPEDLEAEAYDGMAFHLGAFLGD